MQQQHAGEPIVHTSSMPGLPAPNHIEEQKPEQETDPVSGQKINIDKTESSLSIKNKGGSKELVAIEEEEEEEPPSQFVGMHEKVNTLSE